MSQENPTPPQEKKHSLGARTLVALGFGTVGAKIGTLGMIADAKELYAGKNLSMWQKVRGTLDGTMSQALSENITKDLEAGMSISRSLGKAMKYSLITTAVGTAAGTIIGWIRGGRIENWKDIIKHPIDSSKIIFGVGTPKHIKPANSQPESEPTKLAQAETADTKWQDYHAARTQAAQNASASPSL